MRLTLPVVFLLATLLAGCGSGSESSSSDGGSAPSQAASPEAGAVTAGAFFVTADTDAINAAAAPAQQALRRAAVEKAPARCDRQSSKGYDAWRACWHGLLDPVSEGLQGLAVQLNTLASRDFGEDCVRTLSAAADTFTGYSDEVGRLLAGIDGENRKAQSKAVNTYTPTLRKMATGFAEPFEDLTAVCYSPADLESINASPSTSPSP